jgi:hypothetical protein
VGWHGPDLALRRKRDPAKLRIAVRLRKETALSIRNSSSLTIVLSRLALGGRQAGQEIFATLFVLRWNSFGKDEDLQVHLAEPRLGRHRTFDNPVRRVSGFVRRGRSLTWSKGLRKFPARSGESATVMACAADERPVGGIFNTTHWSVVLAASDLTAADARAVGLCKTYWSPLYCCVRGHGYSPDPEVAGLDLRVLPAMDEQPPRQCLGGSTRQRDGSQRIEPGPRCPPARQFGNDNCLSKEDCL